MRPTQRSSTRPAISDRLRSPIATTLVAMLTLGAAATSLPDTVAAAAPDTVRRVDLTAPTFSDPTNITNPPVTDAN